MKSGIKGRGEEASHEVAETTEGFCKARRFNLPSEDELHSMYSAELPRVAQNVPLLLTLQIWSVLG